MLVVTTVFWYDQQQTPGDLKVLPFAAGSFSSSQIMNLSSFRSSRELLFQYFLSLDSPGDRVFLIMAETVGGGCYKPLLLSNFLFSSFQEKLFQEKNKIPTRAFLMAKELHNPLGPNPAASQSRVRLLLLSRECVPIFVFYVFCFYFPKDSRTPNTLGLSSAAKARTGDVSPSDGHEDKENNMPERGRSRAGMLLVTSGLGPSQQVQSGELSVSRTPRCRKLTCQISFFSFPDYSEEVRQAHWGHCGLPGDARGDPRRHAHR